MAVLVVMSGVVRCVISLALTSLTQTFVVWRCSLRASVTDLTDPECVHAWGQWRGCGSKLSSVDGIWWNVCSRVEDVVLVYDSIVCREVFYECVCCLMNCSEFL